MTSGLLIVAHTPSPNTEKLAQNLLEGALQGANCAASVVLKSPFATQPEDVLDARGLLLLTPENLGYMSGALKDFFDRCYYPCLERTQGMPYALVVRAGHDGTGTCLGVEKIATGLRWRKIADPLVCRGAWQELFADNCHELGQAMAEGLDAGIF